jgi:hypothetical protein
MEKKRISVWALLVIFATVLIFTNAVTYLLLLSKSEEWKSVVTDKENNKFKLAKAPAEHVYYDEDSISNSNTNFDDPDIVYNRKLTRVLGNPLNTGGFSLPFCCKKMKYKTCRKSSQDSNCPPSYHNL